MNDDLDSRLHAFRSDLADARLEGRVDAERFVDGVPRRVAAGMVALKPTPDAGATTVTELLYGETFTVFDEKGGWSWGQLDTDGYVGYAPSGMLAPDDEAATHQVSVPMSFLYPEPDLKLPPVTPLPLGSRLALGDEVETRGAAYRLVRGGGAVFAAHVAAANAAIDNDFVSEAERFLNAPYLWGGRSFRGLDCSALVQLAMCSTGRPCPRDSDLQAEALGHEVEDGAAATLHRGDLVFWPNHVVIMIDGEYALHASGHHMMVVIEPLQDAVARIGAPTRVRRP